jgi:formamidopyrimidine-DNA glycosylase
MADLGSGDVLLMHLGMSGSFRVIKDEAAKAPGQFHHPRNEDRAHDHVVFHMSSGHAVIFNDPRRFGYMKIIARDALEDEPLLNGLGPEPLGNEFDAAMLAHSCAGKKSNLKAALLDQRVVAGLGNIYVCEALFRAKISPKRLAKNLSAKSFAPLVAAIKAVLREAIEAGGSSLRDHHRVDGSLGEFQHRFAVYGREGKPCPSSASSSEAIGGKEICGGTIRRIVQSGRSTFYCPKCQR